MMDIKDLKKGMYVSELDRPWLETQFLFQGFRITNIQEIEQLADTCKFVYVDPEKSVIPIPEKATGKLYSKQKNKQSPSKRPPVVKPYLVKFEEEFPKAKQIYHQAVHNVDSLFNEVRMGKAINVVEVKSTVGNIAQSVIRNPDALMLLSALKDNNEHSVVHSVNVCTLSLIFGRYLGLEKSNLYELGTGALLHDVGETLVPEDILRKEDEKNLEEHQLMQNHTTHGVELLKKSKGLPNSVVEIARDHHERVNGSGYPQKLRGNQVSMLTKIVAIVDVYDNVTSGLYGKPAISCTEALKNMYVWREELFDSELVERFIQCLGIYPIGSVVELNTGDIAIVIAANPQHRLFPTVLLVRDKKHQPYEPAKVMNLEAFCDRNNKCQYEIRRVVKPDIFGIDVRNYILRELNLQSA